ncbi:hypothetical protein C9374_012204 [Naegleria lovaniensis]|uniref:Arb2 domain-containing protein n=1 Tax=Naegleria lovaniensis TaxID=51637 RepID=A0AA88KCJ6_NAELO|nr:uncharacterized protein C9374_012204 [Naegleria lovaniensis]KAG2373338.1 hypothetical protein C9374_012204 [Naegleria lovaniensis]
MKKQFNLVLQTIPDRHERLQDFHYTFSNMPEKPNDELFEQDPSQYIQALELLSNEKPGLFVNDMDGGKFHFVSHVHNDALSKMVTKFVQEELLKNRCKLDEIWLPLDFNLPKEQMVNIFMSKDALTNPNKLLILIQGSGGVRAGQWSRSLCYGVIVLNPNQNTYIPSQLNDHLQYKKEDFLSRNKSSLKKDIEKPIPHHESPSDHATYVWDHFIQKAAAKDMVIVAHSAGGWCTMELLKNRTRETLSKVRAVAFTDSWINLSLDPSHEQVREFIVENAVNWVESEKPCNDVLCLPKREQGATTCECRSAGHLKHEYTSECCREAVFEFLQTKLQHL